MTTGVIVARFQTPYLHEGHLELIKEVTGHHNRAVIVLGVSPISGKRNPFDYYTRERMIKASFPGIVILPLRDQAEDNLWSQQLDNLLESTFPGGSLLLYGSRDSFIPSYTGKFTTQELAPQGDYNATELREQFADQVLSSQDFRSGIIYALNNQYVKVYPTVDIAVFREEKSELLLGRKPHESTWRLIGGFVDPEDENFETAALREMKEEAGDLEVSGMVYEMSYRVNDWRYRSERDNITTTLFSCDLMYGKPTPQDDIEELQWFKVGDLKGLMEQGTLNPTHHDLLNHLYNQYKS